MNTTRRAILAGTTALVPAGLLAACATTPAPSVLATYAVTAANAVKTLLATLPVSPATTAALTALNALAAVAAPICPAPQAGVRSNEVGPLR